MQNFVRSLNGLPKSVPTIQSAHAILLLQDKYILQLRDDKPGIAAPGQWSLFGGLRGTSETPFEAIKREIYEELAIKPAQFRFLWFSDYFSTFEGQVIRTWFFVSDVTDVWHQHVLHEGQIATAFDFDQICSLEMPPVMRETICQFNAQGTTMGVDGERSFQSIRCRTRKI